MATFIQIARSDKDGAPRPQPQERKRKRIGPVPRRKNRVFRRDGYRCVQCSSGDGLVSDHIIPRSAGGSNAMWNRQTLCWVCDRKKGSATPDGWTPYVHYTSDTSPWAR